MKPDTPTKKQVISYTNLPGALGLVLLATLWLLMDRLGAPNWSYGLFAIFAALILGTGLHKILTSEQVDLFKRDPAVPPTVRPASVKEVVAASRINIKRNFVDQLEVSVTDESGRVIYTFDPYNVGLGDVLSLRGLRIEFDLTHS